MTLVIPCMMALGGIYYLKVYTWVLVDEVYDCGDLLLVKNRGLEEAVPLTDIINVNANMSVKPSRITLKLARPGNLGPKSVLPRRRSLTSRLCQERHRRRPDREDQQGEVGKGRTLGSG